MNRNIYTTYNDNPRTLHDKSHPIQIHLSPDQGLSLTLTEAASLAHSLTNTLSVYARIAINHAKLDYDP